MKTAQEYIEERSFFDAVKVLYEVPEGERDALWNYRMGYALYFFAINRYPKLCVLRLALGYLERADEDTASKAEIERVFFGKPGGMTARCQEAVENKHGWYAEEPASMSVGQLVRDVEAERERLRRDVTAFFERTQRREIAISHHPAEEKRPVGASKFYGTPDLPAYFDWPYYE